MRIPPRGENSWANVVFTTALAEFVALAAVLLLGGPWDSLLVVPAMWFIAFSALKVVLDRRGQSK